MFTLLGGGELLGRPDENKLYVALSLAKFTCGKRAPVDIFLSIGESKILKVVRKGDLFEKERLRTYENHNVENIFVLRKDLHIYLLYCLSLMEKVIDTSGGQAGANLNLACRVSEVTLMAVQESENKSELCERVDSLCDLLIRQCSLSGAFKSFLESVIAIDNSVSRHSVATALISIQLAHGLKWRSEKNIKVLALGAFLHDVALLNFPEIYNLPREEWSPAAEEAFSKHPSEGASQLISKKLITDERVLRIVMDHEELPDGNGFPNGIGMSKIYPMALPVIMADRLVNLLLNPTSSLITRNFLGALKYLRNREEKFYPSDYWHALETVGAQIH